MMSPKLVSSYDGKHKYKFSLVLPKTKQEIGYVEFDIIDDENSAYINMIFVDENFRNLGYGKELLNNMKQFLKQQRVRILNKSYQSFMGEEFLKDDDYIL